MAVDANEARMPDPLLEQPPASRFCDLVLNGGVASGVVYPWALLHLARHFRFRSIGGNSVGAMAATLVAAAEYGRCHGVEDAFEPLRRLPLKLAEEQDGRTKMLRLFQPSRPVQRLFDLFIASVAWSNPSHGNQDAAPQPVAPEGRGPIVSALKIYGLGSVLAMLILVFGLCSALVVSNVYAWAMLLPQIVLSAALVAAIVVVRRFIGDLQALAENGYGLCSGRSQIAGEEGLVEWLHKGIQLSAGRGREDPPLTFADLWSAPRFGRRGPSPLPHGRQPDEPGIELQMFSSNVTQGRPIRLPISDDNTRLYFDPTEWTAYFSPTVLQALVQASTPYHPASASDPDPAASSDAQQRALMGRLLELPGAGMPIVVAARLSMSFPLLFSCVSVYAVDYEAPRDKRRLRRCLLSDGGLCTNFPIHLFDAAHPTWPTFAFLFDSRLRHYRTQSVWLPETHLEGRGDNWQRGVPGAEDDETLAQRSLASRLFGLAGGLLLTMKDWNDRVTSRLPQVRNRVVRLALRAGEGQLNLAMPSRVILHMAHEYGTQAGIELLERYGQGDNGQGWREHRYVRAMIELRALRSHLKGYARAVGAASDTGPLRQLLRDATDDPPLVAKSDPTDLVGEPRRKRKANRPAGPAGECLNDRQRLALERAIGAVEALEAELDACESDFGPYRPVLEPELRLRPPV